jgi:AraC family transcriptional regulator
VPRSEILLHALASDDPVRLADDSSVVVSSAGAGWSGVGAELQHLPASEPPEGYMPWHLLSVQLSPPTGFEDRDDGRIALAPGHVVFRPAGVATRAWWTGPSETLNLALDPAVVGVELDASRYGPDPVVGNLAAALRHGLADGSADPLLADGVREALAAHLRTRYAGARATRGPRRLSPAELERVRHRIHDGLAEDLRLADLAAAVPLSPYHFGRAFKATTGVTPHRYVMRCRTVAARALLARPDLGIDEIARRTGFSDASHLARHFRRWLGAPPGAFRP